MFLSVRLSNSLWWSDVLLFLYFGFIECIILLYTFLVISFVQYKEYIIGLISFFKFSNVLHDFTCASAIGNLWIICVGVNTVICCPCVFMGSIIFLKALRINSRPASRAHALLKKLKKKKFTFSCFWISYIVKIFQTIY